VVPLSIELAFLAAIALNVIAAVLSFVLIPAQPSEHAVGEVPEAGM
jgi:hypothetical protein